MGRRAEGMRRVRRILLWGDCTQWWRVVLLLVLLVRLLCRRAMLCVMLLHAAGEAGQRLVVTLASSAASLCCVRVAHGAARSSQSIANHDERGQTMRDDAIER